MKKDKKPAEKPKEFVSRPFGALKGVRTEQPAAQPPKAAPQLKIEAATDDAELFLRAMADTRKLHLEPETAPVPRGRPALRQPTRIEAEEQEVFLRAVQNLHLDVTFRDEFPDEDDQAKPLPVNRMRQLRRGAIRVDYQLDLHGLTRDEALESLEAFIASARKHDRKAVLVITGKGNNSPGEPVLLGAVTSWLRDKGQGQVAEFAPAPREMGGGGALVVFLKANEKSSEPETGGLK
jgi:DNA-nicking Smr family endonuclease